MQVSINALEASNMVDSLEFAIGEMQRIHDEETEDSGELNSIRRCIEDLQMIRVTYLLVKRNAAKESSDRDSQPSNLAQHMGIHTIRNAQ